MAADEQDPRPQDPQEAYEAPSAEDVDTETQPAATAAVAQTGPG